MTCMMTGLGICPSESTEWTPLLHKNFSVHPKGSTCSQVKMKIDDIDLYEASERLLF